MTKRSVTECPEARNEGLLTEHVGDELVIFDSETNEAHALKPLAAAVFAAADGATPVVELAGIASSKLGYTVSVSEIEGALEELASTGLLEGSDTSDGVSRRHLLQVGGAAAAGVLVSSALVPALAAASTTTCNAGQASQIALLVENCSDQSYSFLTFAINGNTASGTTISTFSCDAGLNGTYCSQYRPPSGWPRTAGVHWYIDGKLIDPKKTCPASASITVYKSSVSYAVPSGYKVIALYGHALGVTGQYCSGPFTGGCGGTTGTIVVC